jgi:hypothetical protein
MHFRRAPAASRWLRRERRRDDGLGSKVLGHKVGVLAQAVARALDLNDDGVVQQAVQEGCRDDGIAEDLAPFGKAAVGGEDHGAALVAGVDELEEEVAAANLTRWNFHPLDIMSFS